MSPEGVGNFGLLQLVFGFSQSGCKEVFTCDLVHEHLQYKVYWEKKLKTYLHPLVTEQVKNQQI